MDTPKNSCRWALILEGRELLRIYRELGVSKVEHSNNSVAHVLALLGKAGLVAHLVMILRIVLGS
jgi:hypothetical protein